MANGSSLKDVRSVALKNAVEKLQTTKMNFKQSEGGAEGHGQRLLNSLQYNLKQGICLRA